MRRPFRNPEANRPGRSVHDLSYSKLFTCDMGQIIPVMCDEVVPGDKWNVGNEMVIRMQPLVAPVLHEINAFVHYFFVPYRLLWPEPNGWETFITGGVDGDDDSTPPRWTATGNDVLEGKLWDFLGFPIGQAGSGLSCPLDFPRRAYYFIWNEFYRDQTLQDKYDWSAPSVDSVILNRNWSKDYFTSALLWQQRGTAPALPITGFGSAVFDPDLVKTDNPAFSGVLSVEHLNATTPLIATNGGGTNSQTNLINALNMNTVDLSEATTFDVADLRLAFQIQRWMERNARAGVRYPEFIMAHFGVDMKDYRAQRPEYVGGSKARVVVSEVLQTSATDSDPSATTTPQGTLAGHGMSVSSQFCGSYYATEYGLLMGLLSIMPVPMYCQGQNRQWNRRTRYDFFNPAFANLSEQAIELGEIYTTGDDEENMSVFGFQGMYDEMRYKPNMVCSGMVNTFDYWHLGRIFGSAPTLDETFITCNPDKRIFAVQDEPGLIVHFGNIIKAIRPIPISAEPGRIDHG